MDFISVKEAAARWGLTAGRINTLANAGRIPGAQRIGRSWMIPVDAGKPADGRYKQQLQTGKQYHFPLLIFYPFKDQSFLQGLSVDEQRLLEGQLACEACEFDCALSIMKELLNNTRQLYVRIGALYCLCYIAPIMNLPELFKNSRTQLCDILATDFPHKEDFRTILLDIDSLCLGNQVFVENFTLDETQDFFADVIPYFVLQSTYKDIIRSVKERIPMSTDVYALICKNYEQSHQYISAQYLHIYTACAYKGNKETFVNLYHIRRAVELGVKYNSYRILAVFYSIIKSAIDEALKDYDPSIGERISELNKTFDMHFCTVTGQVLNSKEKQDIILTKNARKLYLYDY